MKSIFLLSLTFSSLSWADLISPEKVFFQYDVGTCRAKTSQVGETGVYEYRIDGENTFKPGTPFYTSFMIDTKTGNLVGGLNTCNGYGGTDVPTDYALKTTSEFMTYTVQCGGLTHNQDNVMQVSIEKKTGKVLSLFSDTRIARFGLSGGIHSGPFKSLPNGLKCTADGAASGPALDTKKKILAELAKTDKKHPVSFIEASSSSAPPPPREEKKGGAK